jgi:hypothetical protein
MLALNTLILQADLDKDGSWKSGENDSGAHRPSHIVNRPFSWGCMVLTASIFESISMPSVG